MRNNILKISYLTDEFYESYSFDKYPEILNKENRPYVVWLIKIGNNTFGVPFRTNIDHNSCYKFKKTKRETNKSTGLDYSKAVIINNDKYIGGDASVDNYEYSELDSKKEYIFKRFENYVNNYIKYVKTNNTKMLDIKYKYSTLKYFHEELYLQ